MRQKLKRLLVTFAEWRWNRAMAAAKRWRELAARLTGLS